jgi:hypothetical protein
VLVNDEGVAILSLLKIQSTPFGNFRDRHESIYALKYLTKPYNADFDGDRHM